MYIAALVDPDAEGPFIYREEEGYNSTFLIVDQVLLAIRAITTVVPVVLFCPDYFEAILGHLDDNFILSSKNKEFE